MDIIKELFFAFFGILFLFFAALAALAFVMIKLKLKAVESVSNRQMTFLSKILKGGKGDDDG